MESSGMPKTSLNIDQIFSDRLYSITSVQVELPQLEKLVDQALSREWLERTHIGGDYTRIAITRTGIGAIRSRIVRDSKKAAAPRCVKFSKYVEERKGLLILIGALAALATLIWRILNTDG